MNKVMLYGIIQMVCKVATYGAALYAIFQVSKPAGFTIVGLGLVGLVCAELQFRVQRKQQEQAASEFMQMIANKSGQGNC